MTISRDDGVPQLRALPAAAACCGPRRSLTAGDRHAAEDLVQTALMRVYVAWPRVRPETVDAYARKALLNAMIDNRRRPFARFERSHAEVPDVAVERRDTDRHRVRSVRRAGRAAAADARRRRPAASVPAQRDRDR